MSEFTMVQMPQRSIKLKHRAVKQLGQHRRQIDISKLKYLKNNKEFLLELRNRVGALGYPQDLNYEDPDVHTK